MATINVQTIGTGKMHADLSAFRTWLNTRDLVANDEVIDAQVFNDQVLSTINMYPATYSATNYCVIRPAPGLGVNELDTTGALDYGTVGIELTRTLIANQLFVVSHGVTLEGFRIKVTGTAVANGIAVARYASTTGTPNDVYNAEMRKCRVLMQGSSAGAYAVTNSLATSYGRISDCLFFNESGGNSLVFARTLIAKRNTFVSRGAGAGRSGAVALGNTATVFTDCVFSGCGPTPLNRDAATTVSAVNCFADASITGTAGGFTVASPLIISATDVRPATGSVLIGGASTDADNTYDIRGNFRGTNPDAGAVMLASAALPAVPNATITSTVVSGQTVTVTGTFTSIATSGTATLPAAATPNGAVTANTTVTFDGSNFTAVFNALTPGNYAPAVIALTNSGGTGTSTGGTAVTVAVPGLPTVTITGQSKNGQTVTLSGTVTGNPTSGTATLPAAAVPNGAVSKGPIAITISGSTFTVSFTAVAYGSYDAPTVTVTNFAGSDTESGSPLVLYAPGTQPPGMPAVELPAFVAPTFTAPAVALNGTVTSVTFDSTSPTNQASVPFTFAQAFKSGDLAPDSLIKGVIDGVDVALQFNVKATHPNGSVRHAIISGVIATLNTATSKVMTIVRVESGTSTTPAASTAFPSTLRTTYVNAYFGGVHYIADAAPLLAAGMATGSAWIGGTVATEYVVNVPFKAATDGAEHPHLTAQFNIRYYPTQNVAKVDVVVEHTKAYAAVSDLTYSGDVRVGGVARYTIAAVGGGALVHFPGSRWKRTFWWNLDSPVHIRHDKTYLLASKAVPNYDPRIVMLETTLQSYATEMAGIGFGPMEYGDNFLTAAFGDTGGRKEIGLLPSFAAATVISMDKRAKDITLAIADSCSGAVPKTHLRDNSTGPGRGLPLSVVNFPYATYEGTQTDSKNPATGQFEKLPSAGYLGYSSVTTIAPDTAHHPCLAYLPYLLTGDFYYLEELQFWATRNSYNTNPFFREYSRGLVSGGQMRAQGWALRTLSRAAAITPDNHLLKPHFKYWVDGTIATHASRMVDNAAAATLLGHNPTDIVYSVGGEANNAVGLFQTDFFAQSVGQAAELGYTEAGRLMTWLAKFQVGRMIDPTYCYTNATVYTLRVRDTAASPFYTTLGKCLSTSISPEEFAAPCGSQERLDIRNAQRALPSNPFLLKQIGGDGPRSGTANYQPALAMAVDSGYTDGDLAWSLWESRDLPNVYNDEPQFGIIPRVVSIAPASKVTVIGPNSGVVGVASSYTVGTDGNRAAEVIVTPAATGGTFSPATVTLPIGVSSVLFTFTPTSTGTKTISFTSNSALTNPTPITYTAAAAPDTDPPVMNGALVVSTLTATSFDVTWLDATDYVGVVGYELSKNVEPYISIGLPLGNKTSFSGLASGEAIDIAIRAVDAAGNRSAPLIATVTTLLPPPDVTAPDTQDPVMSGGIIIDLLTSDTIGVSWQAATDDRGIRNYEVSFDGVTFQNNGTATSVIRNGLKPATGYPFSVRANDDAGNTSAPLSVLITTLEAPAPMLAAFVPSSKASSRSYSWLRDSIARWSHRDNLGDMMDDFIMLAERRINGDLEARLQVAATTIRTTPNLDGALLPADIAEIKALVVPGYAPMEYLPPDAYNAHRLRDEFGVPQFYTVFGAYLHMAPTPNAAYDIACAYRQKIPSLLDEADGVNWLIQEQPNIYLAACMLEVIDYTKNFAEQDTWARKYAMAVDAVNGSDWGMASSLRIRTDTRTV